VTVADIAHDFARWGPFVLIGLWALAVAWMRRRSAAQGPGPDVPAALKKRRRQRLPVPEPAAAPPVAAPVVVVARPAPASFASFPPLVEPVFVEQPLASGHAVRFTNVPWREAVVLAEVLGPPLALRRPGTLPPPPAF
jgi:hypothetical protein